MKYVDLFAGCGGLSLGLERAGFELVLAVEKSEMAAETFYHNFIKTIDDEKFWHTYRESPLEDQFDHKVVAKELGELLENEFLMNKLKNSHIDLVVGGPPCQGFSLAGRRNPEDVRNKLPWQYLEFVEKISPKAVVIENVVGMSRGFKKHNKDAPFDQLQQALRETGEGYVVQPIHVNAMHFGVPEHRPRLMIVALRKDIAEKKKIHSTEALWYSNFKELTQEIPALAPKPTIKTSELRTLRDAISDLSPMADSNISKNATSFLKDMRSASKWKLKSKHTKIPNQNRSKHLEKTTERFRLYQYLRVEGLASNTLNIPAKETPEVARDRLHVLYSNATMPAYSPDGTLLARDINELIQLTFTLKTKKHSQRSLDWDKPSPTVVTLPDDYIHPSEPRIFTVRELARVQSFPDAFEFKSKETTGSDRRKFEVPQYSQVGNAVAPLLAYAVGLNFRDIFNE